MQTVEDQHLIHVHNMKDNSEEKDWYIDDNGMFVMTETFHKKRGFCCGNNCRHCPYTKPVKKGNTELEIK